MTTIKEAVATYFETTNPNERRRLQWIVISTYRPRIASYVRSHVPARHWCEAEQVGAIGVLVALEKFDPGKFLTGDISAFFWTFALLHVRNEIQRWVDHGVLWRARSRRSNATPEERAHRSPASLDKPLDGLDKVTLHDTLPSDCPSSEELVTEAEITARLNAFVRTLSDEDREIFLSENSSRTRSRRYLILVKRARSFMRSGDDGSRGAV